MKQEKLMKPVEPTGRLHRGRGVGVVSLIALGFVLLGVVGLVGWAAAALSQGALSTSEQRRETGAIVLLSGRDDHGLLLEPLVSLHRAPDDNTVVAEAADGSFARVVGERGEWLQVQLLDSTAAKGWVNDYYLRSRMLRTDVGEQVALTDAREESGKLRIGVRPVDDPSAAVMWLDPSVLQEIGAQNNR